MKYTLTIAFFALFAIAAAFPSESSEKAVTEAAAPESASASSAPATSAEKSEEKSKVADTSEMPEKVESSTAQVSDEDKCEPGKSFEKECNTCTCPDSGLRSLAGCTLKLCV